MQATLAAIGFVLGILAWWLTGKFGYIAGAVLIVANWPWTFFGIFPTNHALMATELAEAGAETRALLVKWNKLHSVRTVLGVLATVSFLIAIAAS
jgi:hypothetical protein